MKIALYELYKALKSKVLLILFVALFLLNLALSATYTPVPGVPDECIREINKVYLSTSEEEKLSVAESIANKYIKDNVLQNIFPDKKYEDKLNRVKNYNVLKRTQNGQMVKLIRAQGGCLGIGNRRRTWLTAKSCGEL